MNNKRISFTRTDRMSSQKQKCFDLLYDWGYYRFDFLCILLQQFFSEDDMEDPLKCQGILLNLNKDSKPRRQSKEDFGIIQNNSNIFAKEKPLQTFDFTGISR